MLIKVRGGTPASHNDESLCDTCRHSKIIRGRRLDDCLVFCTSISLHPTPITFKVAVCGDYTDNREPSYHELLEQAWILRPRTKRRAAGFVRADDLDAREDADVFIDPTQKD